MWDLPNQASNLYLLRYQVDYLPLSYQRSPIYSFLGKCSFHFCGINASLLGQMVVVSSAFFLFFKNHSAVLLSSCTILHSHLQSRFSASSPAVGVVTIVCSNLSDRCVVISHVVLNCISPVTNDVKHLFTYLFAICIFSSENIQRYTDDIYRIQRYTVYRYTEMYIQNIQRNACSCLLSPF